MAAFESSHNRYYQTIICNYCRRPGHRFRECEEKLSFCNICEQDHDPSTCSLADVCFTCFKRGHGKKDCLEKKSKYCLECQAHGHSTMECENAWRRYEIVEHSPTPTEFIVSCYNCGQSTHFGDCCPNLQVLYQKTAFGMSVNQVEDILDKVERKRAEQGLRALYKPDTNFRYTPGPKGSGGAMSKNQKRKREKFEEFESESKRSRPLDYARGGDRSRDSYDRVDRSRESYDRRDGDRYTDSYHRRDQDRSRDSFDRHDQDRSRNSYDRHEQGRSRDSYDRHGQDWSRDSYDKRDQDRSRDSYVRREKEPTKQVQKPSTPRRKKNTFTPEDRYQNLLDKRDAKEQKADKKRKIQMEKAVVRREEKKIQKSIDSATVVFDERVGLVPAQGFDKVIKNFEKGKGKKINKDKESSDVLSRLGSKLTLESTTDSPSKSDQRKIAIDFADTSKPKTFSATLETTEKKPKKRGKGKGKDAQKKGNDTQTAQSQAKHVGKKVKYLGGKFRKGKQMDGE